MHAVSRRHEEASVAERNFADTLGSFLFITDAGNIDAVDAVWIAPDCDRYELRPAGLNLSVLAPLVAREEQSDLVVRVSCGNDARTSYLMRMPSNHRPPGSSAGHKVRAVPAVAKPRDLVARALDEQTLPVIAQAQIDRILAERRRAGTSGLPLHVPVRSLGLRRHLPPEVAKALRSLVLTNAEGAGNKAVSLREPLQAVRRALRSTVLCDYMMKCVWLNHETGQLGNLTGSGASVQFQPFDADDREISTFLCALEKDPYGDFLLDFREFANVLPTPSRSHPWLGPTVHVYKESFRREHALDEHYSLYAGFKALCAVGAPVLIYRGHNPLLQPTAVRFLKVSDRSINLLQGRILEGPALEQDVRGFTAQELVW